MPKKFLDRNAIKVLTKLLDEYPDNELLGTVIDVISDQLDTKQDHAILIYGTSTFNDFLTAYDNGNNMVWCRTPMYTSTNPNNEFPRYAYLSYVNPDLSFVEFFYYRTRSHINSDYADEGYYYRLTNQNVWSSGYRSVGLRKILIDGDGLTASFDNASHPDITLTTHAFIGATNQAAGTMGFVPAPAIGDETKFLCGNGSWAVPSSGGGAPVSVFTGATSSVTGSSGLVPTPVAGDEDKYLKGDGTWATIINNSITGIKLINTDLVPSNGVITIPAMTACTTNNAGSAGVVPAPAAGDENKFLAGDGTWKAGGLPMVILAYGKSTWQSFIDAYNNNVIVYCRASSNNDPSSGSQTRMAFMAYVNNETAPTEVEFQYYRSVSSHTSSTMGDEVYIYKLNSLTGWSVTKRYASLREIINNSTSLSVSYSSNKITIADA